MLIDKTTVLRSGIRHSILKLLTSSDDDDQIRSTARRALLIYAQCNEMLVEAYARGLSDSNQMVRDIRNARTLALESMHQLSCVNYFSFMPYPMSEESDRADGFQSLLRDVTGWLNAAFDWFFKYDAVDADIGSVSKLEEYSETLADIFAFRMGLFWPNQQKPA